MFQTKKTQFANLNCNPQIYLHPADSTGFNPHPADWHSNFANPTDRNPYPGQSDPVGALCSVAVKFVPVDPGPRVLAATYARSNWNKDGGSPYEKVSISQMTTWGMG